MPTTSLFGPDKIKGDMDSGEEEEMLAIGLLVDNERQHIRRRRQRRMWVRQHFLVRPTLGEYSTTVRNLLDHPDEMVFFNYMRMSYDSFRALKGLMEPHIASIGSNWIVCFS